MKVLKQTSRARPMTMPPNTPLSPQSAYVVQFRAVPGGPTYAAGRVEHLVSGRTTHFQSLEELTAYFDSELHAADRDSSAEEIKKQH